MADKKQRKLPPGIYERRPGGTLWVMFYDGNGNKIRLSTGTTKITEAKKLRAEKLCEAGKGVDVKLMARTTINDLLNLVETDYLAKNRKSDSHARRR